MVNKKNQSSIMEKTITNTAFCMVQHYTSRFSSYCAWFPWFPCYFIFPPVTKESGQQGQVVMTVSYTLRSTLLTEKDSDI